MDLIVSLLAAKGSEPTSVSVLTIWSDENKREEEEIEGGGNDYIRERVSNVPFFSFFRRILLLSVCVARERKRLINSHDKVHQVCVMLENDGKEVKKGVEKW